MLTIERDRSSNYSTIYESVFTNATSLFDQMFIQYETKANIFKMAIYQGALLSLQYMEGDNKYDPKQALYTRRVKQLKLRNKHLTKTIDLEKMTNKLKQSFTKIKSKAHSLQQLDKI